MNPLIFLFFPFHVCVFNSTPSDSWLSDKCTRCWRWILYLQTNPHRNTPGQIKKVCVPVCTCVYLCVSSSVTVSCLVRFLFGCNSFSLWISLWSILLVVLPFSNILHMLWPFCMLLPFWTVSVSDIWSEIYLRCGSPAQNAAVWGKMFKALHGDLSAVVRKRKLARFQSHFRGKSTFHAPWCPHGKLPERLQIKVHVGKKLRVNVFLVIWVFARLFCWEVIHLNARVHKSLLLFLTLMSVCECSHTHTFYCKWFISASFMSFSSFFFLQAWVWRGRMKTEQWTTRTSSRKWRGIWGKVQGDEEEQHFLPCIFY